MLIRYRDLRLFLLDPEHRRYDALPLKSAVTSYARELKAASRGQTSDRLPVRPGTRRPKGGTRVTLAPARLRALPLTTRIGPVRARAYLLRAGAVRQRLWYSDAIPRPPAAVRALLARASAGGGSVDRALNGRTGRIALRMDEPRGRHWRTVLRTTSIRRTAVAPATLRPPAGYRERDLLRATKPPKPPARAGARAASVPADPLRCGVMIVTLAGCLVLDGPISEHPDIWAFYWGSHFKERRDIVSAISGSLHNFTGDEFADPNSKAFWGPLGQYGVGKGRLLGTEIVDENPDDSVGSWNFADVVAFTFTERYGSDAPNVWWRWSDHDPILAVFVDQTEVDSSGWAGYHAFTPTEGLTFAFLAHPAMPWFIVKVPRVAGVSRDTYSADFRSVIDTTTERASHEYVEAATDPYPFISWADPLKEPVWSQGELGDICSQGTIDPWVENTRVFKRSTAFSTYWSDNANACVPESRPSLTLDAPATGSTYGWGAQVTLIATADDLFDGTVTDGQYHWTVDGPAGLDRPLGTGRILNTTSLSPGSHKIAVSVQNSQGGRRLAGPITVNVVVQPPAVRIDAPADGATFAADQKINLRGSAFDPRDGDIGPQAIWSVDGTAVGTGAALLSHQIPTQGAHTVTLSVTNAGGIKAVKSIKVNIGPPTGKPSVTITSPPLPPNASDRYAGPGESIPFSATADAQGAATITDASYVWTDDKDGALGTGVSINHTLTGFLGSFTTHKVTVTVTDSLNRTATDTVTILVGGVL